MKKLIFVSIALIMVLCSCDNNKVYRPSKFPEEQNKRNFSFAIPYVEKSNSIVVRVRLNGGPQFEGIWDSGCSVPLKISNLEAGSLVKDGTLSDSDYQSSLPIKVANGQTNEYAVYMLKSVSFVDEDGLEHTLNNVPAVIDDNVGTDILIGLPVMQKLGYSHEISQYDQFIYFKE